MAFRTFVNANLLATNALEFEKICNKKGIRMNDVLRDFILNYIEENRSLLKDES